MMLIPRSTKTLRTKSSDNLNNDFESEHNIDMKISVKSSNRKKLFFVCFLTALIIGFSIYYKFFINQKVFVESDKIQSLIQYVLDDNDLKLLEFNFKDYSIDLELQVDPDTYFSDNFKMHVNGVMGSDKYNTEIIKRENIHIVSIKYPPFLEIFNSGFDENSDLVSYDSLTNQMNIDKETLSSFLNQSFKINNPKTSNFRIDRANENYYNLQFSE